MVRLAHVMMGTSIQHLDKHARLYPALHAFRRARIVEQRRELHAHAALKLCTCVNVSQLS